MSMHHCNIRCAIPRCPTTANPVSPECRGTGLAEYEKSKWPYLSVDLPCISSPCGAPLCASVCRALEGAGPAANTGAAASTKPAWDKPDSHPDTGNSVSGRFAKNCLVPTLPLFFNALLPCVPLKSSHARRPTPKLPLASRLEGSLPHLLTQESLVHSQFSHARGPHF